MFKWYLWAGIPTYGWVYIKDVDQEFVDEHTPFHHFIGHVHDDGEVITVRYYEQLDRPSDMMRFVRI